MTFGTERKASAKYWQGKASSGPPPSDNGRAHRVASLALAASLAIVLTLDGIHAMRGTLTYVLAAAWTLLLVPWSVLLFARSQPPPDVPVQRSTPETTRQGIVLRLVLLGAVLSLCAAKWVVLGYSSAVDPAYVGPARSYTLLIALALALGIVSHRLGWARFFASVSEHPARLLATSLLATGFVGTLLLSLPIAHESVSELSLVDNFFMAFSAVCVTGLAVNNLAETYTLFGQGVLCLLVQVGGLGIMALSAAIALLVGQRLRVRSSRVFTEVVEGASLSTLRRKVTAICVFTLVIEGFGILLLYLQFRSYPDLATRYGHPSSGAGSALWAAVFHGVSAFCNAGFSNFHEGLAPFRGHPGVMSVVVALIMLGGIGFPVLSELAGTAWTRMCRRRPSALSLHTRVTLRLTAVLFFSLAFAYLALEWAHGLSSLPYIERFLAAFFQSASARTAGFNVIDLATLTPASLVLTCAAMFTGAGSGSTAGGIKLTTAAALYSGLRAELTGTSPSLMNRVLPDNVIRKAVGVAVLSSVIVVTAFFVMLLCENHPPLDVLFEVVSAFSTTGLSTGVTPNLSVAGKLVIIAMMFIGRIGPLTFALAVATKAPPRPLRLPGEPVLIG